MGWSLKDTNVDRELLLERILRKAEPAENGCLLWQGAKAPGNYGLVQIEGRTRPVHRVTYELVVGEIPEGKMLLHACDTPNCIEPSHLRIGTAQENAQDAAQRGRLSSRKTRATSTYVDGAELDANLRRLQAACSQEPSAQQSKRLLVIAKRFRLDERTGCCWWTTGLDAAGYGTYSYIENGVMRNVRAPRFVYETLHGPIQSSSSFVLHSCDTPACVNPAHLRLGTHEENMRDVHERKRHQRTKEWLATEPERQLRGELWQRAHLAQIPRGEDHYMAKDPEKREAARTQMKKVRTVRYGDDHHARKDPEKAKARMLHAVAVRVANKEFRPANTKLDAEKVREMRRLHEEENVSTMELARRFGVSWTNAKLIVTRKAWQHVE